MKDITPRQISDWCALRDLVQSDPIIVYVATHGRELHVEYMGAAIMPGEQEDGEGCMACPSPFPLVVEAFNYDCGTPANARHWRRALRHEAPVPTIDFTP
jgi:hypothetical protein